MNRKKTLGNSRIARFSVGRRMMLCGVVAIGAALTALGAVVTAVPATISGIILLVGADESQRVVNWYASANTTQVVQVAPTSALLPNGDFPANATSYAGVVAANIASSGGFNGHATLDGLQPNTAYSYRVSESGGGLSPTLTFKTQSFTGDFDFLFFGDPQIGSSGDTTKDGAGWADTLNVALAANPDVELLESGGDQVETANTESQWTAFLAPAQLRSYPFAATIGNHDVGGKAYDQHLWTPNTNRANTFFSGSTTTNSGGDYWFMFKKVLFIHLNSNAFQTTGVSGSDSDVAHIGFITDTINQVGAAARYTVLVYHHSIYSPGEHANDSDNKKRRIDFPTQFSLLGVDLVLQGHDHSYSRSYLIDSGVKENPAEQPGATTVFQGPGGVIYVTGNSASGSKYYELSRPTGAVGSTRPVFGSDPLYGPDPLNPVNHWANSVENQEHVRTYVKIKVRNNVLSVENIRSGTCAAPNAALERGNVTGCGPNLAGTALPVGSSVDKVDMLQPASVPTLSSLTDGKGATWSLGAGASVLRNGAAVGLGSQIKFLGGVVYVLGIDNQWWQWQDGSSSWLVLGAASPVPPGAVPNASAEGTYIPPATQIIDAFGDKWTLSAGGQALRNGASTGGGGSKLLWTNGVIYAFGGDGNWWAWQPGTSTWTNFGPLAPGLFTPPAASASGALAPPLSQLVDANGAIWTIDAGSQILRNGSPAGTGFGTKLLWKSGVIYTLGLDNNWWKWNLPGSWSFVGPTQP